MANEQPAIYVGDRYLDIDGISYGGSCLVGNFDGDASKGAMRFTGVSIPQGASLNFAKLYYKYGSVGDSGNWKFRCYGIDEDNTGSFGYPFGRAKTTAYHQIDEGAPTGGGTKDIDVKDIVKEIIDRGGWSSGNALGFLLENDGSASNVYAFADSASFLIFRFAAEPNFFPTPVTVSAPTFPATDSYGIKISKPGVEVLTATRSQLLFTTREDVTKIQSEAQVATTAGVEKLIAHGLAYKPECLCYIRKNGYSFELPRVYGDFADPVGNGARGYYSVDSTYLRIYTGADADVYYYILLDEQPA